MLTLVACGFFQSPSLSVQDETPSSRPAKKPTSAPLVVPVFDYQRFDKILAVGVSSGGRVDYRALEKSQRKALGQVVATFASFDAKKLKTKADRIAFYANAYNANVLKMVLDNKRPKSVLDVKGFFDKHKFKVAGRSYTLNSLEKILRDEGDPRVHFIVNCASASCPKLLAKSIRAKTLEKTLAAATEDYLSTRQHGLRIDRNGKVWVSKIFEWYAKDFAKNGNKAQVLAWIQKHAPASSKKQLAKATLMNYLKYDWSLNQ